MSPRYDSHSLGLRATGRATVVYLPGEDLVLTEETAPALEALLTALVEDAGWHRLVLDLANVRLLTSAVLGSLLRVRRRVRARGGSLTLRHLDDNLREVFEVTRLSALFGVGDPPPAAPPTYTEP